MRQSHARSVVACGLGAGLAVGLGCGGDGSGETTDGPPVIADGAPPPPECRDAGGGGPDDATTPGEAALPSPTTRSLTIEWAITGDADLDATVGVRFRRDGGMWRVGPALRRIPAGAVEGFAWANRFAGSVFALEPGARYDVELALSDPDGGCEVRTLSATTRPIPAPMAGAPITAVDPTSFAAAAAAADPGEILELAAGSYDGFTLTRDGAPGMPIVVRAAAGATVSVTGDVRLDGRSHVIVDGLTIAGKIKFNDGRDLAIVRNHVTTTEDGIVTKTRAEDLYIADNVVVGATAWSEAALGVDGDNVGEGIEVTGPGHVIEHNRVRGFRDCISLIEDAGAIDQYAIDIADNDLSECADDAIEADFCAHDCRITGNRMTNVFIAMSSQPGLGGPTWFVRNVAYNVVLSAFKLQRGSVGDVIVHNTVVKSGDAFGIYTDAVFSRQWIRNNLFLGGPGGTFNGYSTGDGRVLELRAADATVDLDYDGYGSATGTFTGFLGATGFDSVAELHAATTATHVVEVAPATAFAAGDGAAVPASPFPGVSPPDLRPSSASAGTDAGVPLAGLNDGAAGGPDLGAYEAGSALPTYGPR
jgi:hypothetical protein